jgi:hypothetical protein
MPETATKDPSGFLATKEASGYLTAKEASGYLTAKEASGYLTAKETSGYLAAKEPTSYSASKQAAADYAGHKETVAGFLSPKEPASCMAAKDAGAGTSYAQQGPKEAAVGWSPKSVETSFAIYFFCCKISCSKITCNTKSNKTWRNQPQRRAVFFGLIGQLGLGSEFRSKKIPRNRLGMVPSFRGRKHSFRGIPSTAKEPVPKFGTERMEFRGKN